MMTDHKSDCAVHNEPAMKAGPCDCGVGLIERLEQAVDGSRELDWEVHHEQSLLKYGDRLCGVGVYGNHPHYTTSVDDACKLVPENWQYGVSTFSAEEIFNPSGAQAFVTSNTADRAAEGYQHADAATPALALCPAALKAWEQINDN